VLHTTTGSYSKNNVSLDVRGEEVVKDKNRNKLTCLRVVEVCKGWPDGRMPRAWWDQHALRGDDIPRTADWPRVLSPEKSIMIS
jgi:hypothetical protein